MKLSYGKEIRSLLSLRKTAGARAPALQYTHHIQKPQKYAILKTPITQYSKSQFSKD